MTKSHDGDVDRASIAFLTLFMQGKIAPGAGSLYNFRS
jgi:hypothetical protein